MNKIVIYTRGGEPQHLISHTVWASVVQGVISQTVKQLVCSLHKPSYSCHSKQPSLKTENDMLNWKPQEKGFLQSIKVDNGIQQLSVPPVQRGMQKLRDVSSKKTFALVDFLSTLLFLGQHSV